jgi:hypothetical protein
VEEIGQMIGRAVLFLILGVVEGVVLGAISLRAFVAIGDAGRVEEAAAYWAVIGAIHGIVLFFASLGETPVIEDTRRGRFVASGLARGFDYRRFGHRIAYIALAFGLAIALAVAPLLANRAGVETTSMGMRLVAGIGLCFVWTGVAMLANTVVVSKIALR